MRIQLLIRPTQQTDKEAVLKFCAHTFDWGDYIGHVWDRWLLEKHARLFTATLNDKPVGIMHVSLQKPGEAWMQGARTDPQFRRKGVATALAEACLRWAVDRGVEIVRLVTDSDNHVAQKTIAKLGFTKVSDFLTMECEELQTRGASNSRWAKMTDLKEVMKFLKKSEIFEKSGGLYTVIFEWKSLDSDDLRSFVTDKKVIIHKNGDVIDGIVLTDEAIGDAWEELAFQTCYIDGDFQSIVDMMNFFKKYSLVQRKKKIYAFACNVPVVVEALTESGFTQEEPNTEFIHQKRI